MITDKIENMPMYFACLPRLKEVYAAACDCMAGKYTTGQKVSLDGDALFYSVSAYGTKSLEGAKYESHFNYADVQLVISGAEAIYWAPLTDCTLTDPAKEGSDIAFYNSENGSPVVLHPGCFTLLMPQDAHMPCISPCGKAGDVVKAVFKVKL